MEPTQSSMDTGSRVKQYDRPVTGYNDVEGMDKLVQREDIDQDRLLDQNSIDQVARDAKSTQGKTQSATGLDTEPMDIMVQREDIDNNLQDRTDIPRHSAAEMKNAMNRQQQSSEQQSKGRQSMGQQPSDEMSRFRADLDDLVARIPGLSEMDLNTAKEKLLNSITSYRQTAMNYASEARQQLNQRVEATGQYVKEKPMQSIGIAAGVGFLLGLLASRRS